MVLQETQTLALQSLLERLKMRVDGVEEVLCLWNDGAVLAHLQQIPQSAEVAIMLAEFVHLAECACLTSSNEGHAEAMMKGKKRFLAFYRHRSRAVLGVLGKARTNTGLLHLECRSTLANIHAVLSESV